MIPDAELREIRGDADDFLPNWATVQRDVETSDGGGGWEDGWGTVGRYRCRLGVPSQLDRTFADGIAEIAEWVVTFPAFTDVRHGDRLLTGKRTLKVIGVAAGRSFELHLRVACTEVR